ncbi:MAG: Na+:solute symporter, partial [Desulfobulbaceae bacterium]|nr:Na+:solute symporter [Desulfobulbaceae bacterium]
ALLMVLAGLLALVLESAVQGFQLLLSVGAGTGLLFFLRWFWSRINAWSEIAAMILSFGVSVYLHLFASENFELWQRFALTVGITTIGWILIALVTPRTSPETLRSFEERIAERSGGGLKIGSGIVMALVATAGVYGLLFGTGLALYGRTVPAMIAILAGAAGLLVSLRFLKHVEVA